jgi:penicillin amidase
MAATWLAPQEVTALLNAPRLKTVTEFRQALAAWHGAGLNMVLADDAGTIGWQMIGEIPQRKSGHGALPLAGWDLNAGWADDYVDSTRLPSVENPDAGYIATANNRPVHDDGDPFLSVDWIEGYRIARLNELLAPRDDWDIPSTLHAQLDTITLAWSDLREQVLGIGQRSSSAAAYALLRDWDGNMHRHSAAASVFVLWNTEMQRRVALARAPLSAAAALGRGFAPDLVANSLFAFGRTSHLVRLLRQRPAGWFDDWDEEMAAALAVADALLRVRFGDAPEGWEWGIVRPLTLRHPIGERRPMDKVFNIGPMPWSGDFTTVSQSGAPPLEPLGNPSAIASLRMAIDVGDWDRSRFSLPGGQSGNPLSPHYSDQVDLWAWGVGCPMPWSEAAVTAAVVETLHLVHAVEDDN